MARDVALPGFGALSEGDGERTVALPGFGTIYLPAPSGGETVVGAGGSLHPIGIGAVGLARGMSAIEYGSPT